jgi:hypothetical protein
MLTSSRRVKMVFLSQDLGEYLYLVYCNNLSCKYKSEDYYTINSTNRNSGNPPQDKELKTLLRNYIRAIDIYCLFLGMICSSIYLLLFWL